jgi:hypothetical protein
MLRKEPVNKALQDVLIQSQALDIFDDYFLVGGTALSLQIGHRISEDINLFTRNDINKEEIFSCLNKEYKNDFQIKIYKNQ